MVTHAFNASTREAEAGESLWVQGQSGLLNKLQDSQGYAKKPCLEIQKANKKLCDKLLDGQPLDFKENNTCLHVRNYEKCLNTIQAKEQ